MIGKRKSWSSRLESLALTALHAFPALYCRSRLLRPDTPAAFIVDAYREELVAKLHAMPFWQRWLVVFIWPPAMVLMAIAQTAVNGRHIARRHHRSIAEQFSDQIRLAFAHGVPATYYYLFELHDPQNRLRAHEYIYRGYLKAGGLYARLYRATPERGHKAKILNDKKAFSQFLMEHKLPATRVIASVENGAFSYAKADRAALPAINLFVKPRTENGGTGAERWLYNKQKYRGSGKLLLDSGELSDHLAALSRRQPYLIQECLQNHHGLQDLSAGALSTLRIYTCWNEKGEVEHLFTMLRMSQDARSVVDNVCHGGLAARVDPATGTLGLATDGATLARTRWLEAHPFTGAVIAGHHVPFWSEALNLAIAAHRQLKDPIFIGWDIAITEDGPVIVEGNKSPDIEIEQRLSGPWGNQRFGQLLVYHLKTAATPIEHPSEDWPVGPAARSAA